MLRKDQSVAQAFGAAAFCCILLFGAAYQMPAQVPQGIPRALAVERAGEISDLRYRVSFVLNEHPESTGGKEEIRFRLARKAPLLLDFRQGSATNLAVNGNAAAIQMENGHILLPAQTLRAGENTVTLEFKSPVGPAGKAITRYDDHDDGSTYIYTLFVPMDASMAFPCFDQPDLKGRFALELTVPTNWNVIANSNELSATTAGTGLTRHTFAETHPISTYLFAFAAGPFENVHPVSGLPRVFVRKSQVARGQPEIPQIQDVTARGMKFQADYFAQPFPFPKYDMVLIPGFPYGGMEHAGATFLSEDAMLFRRSPTETDRFNRSVTILHELAHQWFGDFTTMRWFDDLWLKEGFAQYMAFRTLDALVPDQNVWKRFYEQIKPAAYAIDVTAGTTPIYQNIPNLIDAKSAYGAIVYSKAPGLLRSLAFLIGDDKFRDGLRLYLHEHAYANAEWSDLVHALERSSGQNLHLWAAAWIRRRGLPEVTVSWSCDAQHRIQSFTVNQRNVLGEGGVWPIATQILLGYTDRAPVRLRAQFDGATAAIPEAVGQMCPAYVFSNDQDYGYGLFMLDDLSREYVLSNVGQFSYLFQRTLMWGALWDSVRFTELEPKRYLSVVLRNVASEKDEALTQSLGGRSAAALHYYVNASVRSELVPRFESLVIDRMLHSDQQGLRIMWFRALSNLAQTPNGLNELKKLLNGGVSIPDVQLRSLDRWGVVSALIAQSDPDADALYLAEQKRDQTDDGRKYTYVVGAAKPDAATKKWYFDDYLRNPSRQEDWVQTSLSTFNEWNQAELTFAYLSPALDALPQVKQQRKIFFVLDWLGAFIGGQSSEAASLKVHQWLDTAQLDPDLRLKVLQILDGLDRAVKIKQRFP